MKTQYTTRSSVPSSSSPSSTSVSSSSAPSSDETTTYVTQSSSNEMNFSQIFENAPNYGEPPIIIGSNQHQHLWEQGQIDYTGRDSFSNILAHLDNKLNK